MSVRSLGYLGVVSDAPIDDWVNFSTNVLGASVERHADRLRLRIDEHLYRVEVEPGDRSGLSVVGWDMGNEEGFRAMLTRLDSIDCPYSQATPEQCARRGVLQMACLKDPAGICVELFFGRMAPHSVFVSPVSARFVTGDLGLGHLVCRIPNFEATLRFYREVLGFRVSDVWTMNSDSAVFLHCNPRHHSIAFRGGDGAAELIHFMLEVDNIDTVGLASDRGRERISRSLGRHFNDGMLSCYFRTPAGFEVEYGTGGRRVDDATWLVGQIDAPSGWGHARS